MLHPAGAKASNSSNTPVALIPFLAKILNANLALHPDLQ